MEATSIQQRGKKATQPHTEHVDKHNNDSSSTSNTKIAGATQWLVCAYTQQVNIHIHISHPLNYSLRASSTKNAPSKRVQPCKYPTLIHKTTKSAITASQPAATQQKANKHNEREKKRIKTMEKCELTQLK